jgi:hypothetical protein
MHLIIRAKGVADAAVLQAALKGSRHLVVIHSEEKSSSMPADAEFLPMSMAEALGLSLPTEVLKIAIVPTPPSNDWIDARFVIIGMMLDHNYSKEEELQLLIYHIYRGVCAFNLSHDDKICSIGIHQDLLNMSALPLSRVADAILKAAS